MTDGVRLEEPFLAKLCSKCMKVKEPSDFHRQASMPDGRTTICKECKREYNRSIYRKQVEDGTRRERYVKGVGIVSVKAQRVARLMAIKERFRDWCKNGGEFK